MTMAVTVETVTDTITVNSSAGMKKSSHSPASKSFSEVIQPDITDSMNTSPWAKLMKPSTP